LAFPLSRNLRKSSANFRASVFVGGFQERWQSAFSGLRDRYSDRCWTIQYVHGLTRNCMRNYALFLLTIQSACSRPTQAYTVAFRSNASPSCAQLDSARRRPGFVRTCILLV